MLSCFGDSNTFGVGASTKNKSWVGLYSPTNLAVSGSQAAEVSNAVQTITPVISEKYSICIGTNDVRQYKSSPAKMGFYEKFLRQAVCWLKYPDKVLAKDMTLSGSWVNTVVNGFGRNSTYQGDSASCQVSGDKIFIAYIIQNNVSAVSSADVYIDNLKVGSIVSDGYSSAMTTVNGLNYASACDVFDTTPGLHDVSVLITSANGKKFYLDYVCGNDQISPPVVLGNISKYSNAGYSYYGVTQTIIESYNTVVSQIASEFGLPIADIYATVDPAYDLYDYVHLNDSGHQKVHDIFVQSGFD